MVPAQLAVFALLVAGCCPSARTPAALPSRAASRADLQRAAREVDGFRRLREQHDVVLELSVGNGVRRERATGLLAVERPGKLRLVALGPAGVKLFDLRVVRDRVEVLAVIGSAAQRDRLRAVLQIVARDLQALYRIGPFRIGGRLEPSLWADQRGVVASARVDGLSMRYARYDAAGKLRRPRWMQMRREGRYVVTISVRRVEVDPELDRRLFDARDDG